MMKKLIIISVLLLLFVPGLLFAGPLQDSHKKAIAGMGGGLGDNVIVNGDFANWTGDNPDNWTLRFTEDASNYVTEDPSGQCKIVKVTDGYLISQLGSIASGVEYFVSIDINSINDTIQFRDEFTPIGGSYTTTGTKTFTFTAASNEIRLRGLGTTVIDNISFREVL